MLYPIYRGVTELAGPLVPIILNRRAAAGKEDDGRRGERLGRPSRPRPPGRLVWVHAASVGEALSVQSVIRRLLAQYPGLHVLVTTGTVTSAALMAERLPDRALHQFVPIDRMAYVRPFLDHWRPDLVIWVESELWPNMLREVHRRGTPAVLINARMSQRSYRGWLRVRGTARRLLDTFQLILPWNEEQAERLSQLGARAIGPIGNLKFSADPLEVDAADLAAMREAIGDRHVWLAASTHAGEDELVGAAHAAVAAQRSDLLTVIVPRHPARGEQIAAQLSSQGLTAMRRATELLPTAACQVYIADTMGEMGLFLRLAPIVLIGGSLVPLGGHNPVEAAQLDTAILYGPHMTNFVEITRQLDEVGGGQRVTDSTTLTRAIRRLFDVPAERQRMATAALRVAQRNRGVIDAAMAALVPLLVSAGIDRAA